MNRRVPKTHSRANNTPQMRSPLRAKAASPRTGMPTTSTSPFKMTTHGRPSAHRLLTSYASSGSVASTPLGAAARTLDAASATSPGGLRLRRTSFAAAVLRFTGAKPDSSCHTTLIGIVGSCLAPTRCG